MSILNPSPEELSVYKSRGTEKPRPQAKAFNQVFLRINPRTKDLIEL